MSAAATRRRERWTTGRRPRRPHDWAFAPSCTMLRTMLSRGAPGRLFGSVAISRATVRALPPLLNTLGAAALG